MAGEGLILGCVSLRRMEAAERGIYRLSLTEDSISGLQIHGLSDGLQDKTMTFFKARLCRFLTVVSSTLISLTVFHSYEIWVLHSEENFILHVGM